MSEVADDFLAAEWAATSPISSMEGRSSRNGVHSDGVRSHSLGIETANALPMLTPLTRERGATHITKLLPPRRDRNYIHRDLAV